MDNDYVEKINKYQKSENKLLLKHGLEKIPTIAFPKYAGGKIPWLVKKAVAFIERHDPIILNHFIETK